MPLLRTERQRHRAAANARKQDTSPGAGTVLPGAMAPLRTASSSASGMDAALVLP